jgi:hypothetical protein
MQFVLERSVPFFAFIGRLLSSLPIATLQLRVNCLARPLKHGGDLNDGLTGLEQFIQLL